MNGYFDCLVDQIPQTLIDRMHKACENATHRGAGRDSEPALMAGVRALIDGMVTPEQMQNTVNGHKLAYAEAIADRDKAVAAVELITAEEREQLKRVRGLLDMRRKTVSMDAVAAALRTLLGRQYQDRQPCERREHALLSNGRSACGSSRLDVTQQRPVSELGGSRRCRSQACRAVFTQADQEHLAVTHG